MPLPDAWGIRLAVGTLQLPFHARICFPSRVLRRPPTLARGGMIVASHPLAVEAGASVLRRGGHAIDAAIAAGAVLAVVEPSASGVGGDAFFLVRSREDAAVVAVNGSGRAPGDLARDRFGQADSVPLRSPASCTTPGCVRAWWDAWSRWGRVPWDSLLAPAVELASKGFPVSWRMGSVNARMGPVILADPGLRSVYAPAGRPLLAGEICRPRAQAETLATLAKSGADAFYGGALGDALAKATRAAGGALSAADLAAHATRFTDPYRYEAGSWALLEQPLPSQGLLLSVMYGMTRGRREEAVERPAEELHRQCEAKKVAFALKEAFLTDPEYLPVPEEALVTALLDPEVLSRLAQLFEEEPIPSELASEVVIAALEDTRAGRDLVAAYRETGLDPARPPRPGNGATDTTYLCCADGEGNQVGLIQSIFHVYGSGFLDPATGILLNNRACGFSLHPGHVNALAPGKRTLHTLNSYMVERRDPGAPRWQPWLVGGTPGGDNQVQTNLQILRHIEAGRDLWAGPPPEVRGKWTQARRARSSRPLPSAIDLLAVALESPRWRVESNGRVRIESRMPAAIRKQLARRGHVVTRIGPWEGSGLAQLLATVQTEDGGHLHVGATDPRGEGLALGL